MFKENLLKYGARSLFDQELLVLYEEPIVKGWACVPVGLFSCGKFSV